MDLDGQPVAGARVWLIRREHPGLPVCLHDAVPLNRRRYPETRTDAQGHFSFRIDYGDTVAFFAQTRDRMSLPTTAVTVGGFRKITVWGITSVWGRCSNGSDGSPKAGLPVHVMVPPEPGAAPWPDSAVTLRLSTRTDAEGRYRVRIPDGTWVRILIQGPGYCLQKDLHGQNENDFAIGPDRTSVHGQVLGTDRRPLPGVLVQDAADPRIQARSDDQGRFWITPRHGDHGQHWLSMAAGGAPHITRIVPNAKAIRGHATVRATQGHRIRARLVDWTGAPLAHARVVLAGYNALQPSQPAPYLSRWLVRTDQDGVLTTWAPQGCKYLAAFVEMDGRFVWFYTGAPRGKMEVGNLVIYPQDGEARLHLASRAPAGNARVRVLRLPDDKSRESVIIHRHLSLPHLVRYTNPGGRIWLRSLPVGRYQMAIEHPGHLQLFHRFEIKATGNRCMEIRVPPCPPVQGMVLAGGKPLAGADVRCTPTHGGSNTPIHGSPDSWRFGLPLQARIRTDRRGRFAFLGLRSVPRVKIQVRSVAGNAAMFVKPGAKSDALTLAVH